MKFRLRSEANERNPASRNKWIGFPSSEHRAGLDDAALKAVVGATAYSSSSLEDWEARVVEAEVLITQHFRAA